MKENDERALSTFKQYKESITSRCTRGTVMVVVIEDLDVDLSVVVNGPIGEDSCELNCSRCNNSSNALPRTQYETCICVHAEIRAITTNLEHATVYVNRTPCTACWLALLDDPRVDEIVVIDGHDEPIAEHIWLVIDHLIAMNSAKVRMLEE